MNPPQDATVTQYPREINPWRRVLLGDICRVVGGSTPRSGEPELWNGDIVWVTPTDLGQLETPWITQSARRITEAGYASCGTELLPVGTVVMSSRAPIGHLGVAAVPLCTNQGCKSFVPGPDVDSTFLLHLLRSRVDEFRAMGSGATFAEVSKTQLEKVAVEIPPLVEQKRIAARLGELLAEAWRALAAIEGQATDAGLLHSAVVHEMLESERTQTWPRRMLGQVLQSTRNGLYKPAEYYGAGTPIVKMFNIGRFDGRWNLDRLDAISLTAREADEYSLRPGDIVLNRVNSRELVGKCAMVVPDLSGAVFESKNMRLRVDAGVIAPELVTVWLNGPRGREHFGQRVRQIAGMATLNRSDLERLELPIPPRKEQVVLVRNLETAAAGARLVQELLNEELNLIRSLPRALLRAAFAGTE